jgi:hypothetical protein
MGSATTLSETNKVSTARLLQARTVLRHSRTLVEAAPGGGSADERHDVDALGAPRAQGRLRSRISRRPGCLKSLAGHSGPLWPA